MSLCAVTACESFRAVTARTVSAVLFASLASSLTVSFAVPLGAQSIIANRDAGLNTSALVRTLPFTLADNFELIDDVLTSAHGVTFTNAVFLANPVGTYPIPNGAATIGFAFATGGAITMQFAAPISAIAFQAFAQIVPDISETRFEAYDGSALVSSFTGRPPDPSEMANTAPLKWWGFEGGVFDRVVVTAPTTRNGSARDVWGLGLTNITIEDVPALPSAVPEPGALVLLAAGFLGAIHRRYRTR